MTLLASTPALILGAAALAAAGAATADDLCPPAATPADTMPAPEGWRAWRTDEARSYKLADMTFSDGPPEERALLSPASSVRHGSSRTDTYDFTAATLRDVWVICQYRNTTIALVRQSDLRGKRCQLEYAKNGPVGDLTSIACK